MTRYFAKGEECTDYKPGDFLLVAHKGFWASLIVLGQKLRYGNTPYVKWNHAALVQNIVGDLIEADGGTTCHTTNISQYKDFEYLVVDVDASVEDRAEVVAFAESCLGQEYGIATIICIAFCLFTGLKISFGFPGQSICSGLVARSLERTREIFKKDTSSIMPCELAAQYLS